MQLIDAVQLTNHSRLALVGAGGKTTAMFRLAEQWVSSSEKTIFLTTSTHLAETEVAAADHHIVVIGQSNLDPLLAELPQGIVLLSGPAVGNSRVEGLPENFLEKINQIADHHQVPLLVEADGSAQRPLKAPAAHEPVIPNFANIVMVVVGMGVLGERLDKNWVHRFDLFSAITGLAANSRITAKSIANMLQSPEGGLKGIPAGAQKVVLLNQSEKTQAASAAKSICRQLLQNYRQVIIASLKLKGGEEVISNNFKAAGIILAAGGSQRLGQPKQLLDWQGQPFVRAVANTALNAGLSPVYVVVGASASEVESALAGLDVEIVHNPTWESGQASSLKIGVEQLLPDIQAAVVLLVDQPQVPATLVDALIAEHASQNVPIVAPMIDHRRGNPVLFDRDTFGDLISISGDVGGREIFSRYPVHLLPWLDPRLRLDVDSQEDYQNLLAAWKTS